MAVACQTAFPADPVKEGKFPEAVQAALDRVDAIIAKVDATEKLYHVSYQAATRDQYTAHYRAYTEAENTFNGVLADARKSNSRELAKLEARYAAAEEAAADATRNPYLPADGAERYMQPDRADEQLTEAQLKALKLKIKSRADLEARMTSLHDDGERLRAQRHPIRFHPLLGQPAPALILRTVDGKDLDLSDYRGKKLVILSFWTIPREARSDQRHWASAINDLLQNKSSHQSGALAGMDVVAVGVNVDNTRPKKVARYVRKKGWIFPILVDRGGRGSRAYDWGKKGCQTIYIIDRSGRIRRRYAMVLNKHDGRYYAEHTPADLLKHTLAILAEEETKEQ